MPLRIPSLPLHRSTGPLLPRFVITSPQSLRPFTHTPRPQLKEDANHTPESAENLKQEQLKKQDEGKGEWHEGLGSASESHVKADREDVSDHGEHMSELQEMGKQQAEGEKK